MSVDITVHSYKVIADNTIIVCNISHNPGETFLSTPADIALCGHADLVEDLGVYVDPSTITTTTSPAAPADPANAATTTGFKTYADLIPPKIKPTPTPEV